jgi:AcrR family transcriptional regulator
MESDRRLDEILEAAYTCFTRHGVRRSTMDDIAREAGKSRAAVYQYVRNKEDAFRRLTKQLLDTALDEAAAAVRAGDTPAERLAAAMETKLALVRKLWHDSPAHAAELLGEGNTVSAALLADYNTAMRELVADAVAENGLRTDPDEFAELVLALTCGLEADLSDPHTPVRRLRRGVTLLVQGLDRYPNDNQEQA